MKIIKSSEKENQWVSISGLFSILMMIFLFLSIAYMGNIILKQKKITVIAQTYEETQKGISHDLKKEFTQNLRVWNAVLDSLTLSIRFEDPGDIISSRKCRIKPTFQKYLR